MNLRGILRIARWETTRGIGGLDRRAALLLLVLLIVSAAIAPVVVAGGVGGDEGLYRVAVDQESRYAEVVDASPPLRAVPMDRALGSGAELVIDDGIVKAGPSGKSQAALATLRSAVTSYNDALMDRETDQSAAFPVRVTLRYVERARLSGTASTPDSDGDGENQAGTGDDGTGSGQQAGEGIGDSIRSMVDALLGGRQTGTPGGIAPPVPVRSLILAFLFVVPLNVVIQAYGSAIMTERLNRRGEPLLVTPLSRYAVVAGKTLPYLLAAIGIVAVVALLVGGGLVSVVAMIPLAVLFLSATFVAALFARSYRELSFLTVAISVFLTAYAFVPAIFAEVVPIASMSPLSIVVFDLSGDPIGVGSMLFAIIPATLVACTLFALGIGVFSEEELFDHSRFSAKLLDAFAAKLRGRGRLLVWSALLVPFVFVAELLAVAVLFAVQAPITIPILLSMIAVTEEGAKALLLRAGFTRSILADTTALSAGVQAGVGFAIAEKIVLVVQFIGLSEFPLARAAFAPAGVEDPVLVAGLLFLPFGMHVATTTIIAYGARRSRPRFLTALAGAILLHFTYDLLVVIWFG